MTLVHRTLLDFSKFVSVEPGERFHGDAMQLLQRSSSQEPSASSDFRFENQMANRIYGQRNFVV